MKGPLDGMKKMKAYETVLQLLKLQRLFKKIITTLNTMAWNQRNNHIVLPVQGGAGLVLLQQQPLSFLTEHFL